MSNRRDLKTVVITTTMKFLGAGFSKKGAPVSRFCLWPLRSTCLRQVPPISSCSICRTSLRVISRSGAPSGNGPVMTRQEKRYRAGIYLVRLVGEQGRSVRRSYSNDTWSVDGNQQFYSVSCINSFLWTPLPWNGEHTPGSRGAHLEWLVPRTTMHFR